MTLGLSFPIISQKFPKKNPIVKNHKFLTKFLYADNM